MIKITNWKARRAGGRITVYGTDKHRNPTKVTNVDTIEPKRGRVIATDKDAVEYELLS